MSKADPAPQSYALVVMGVSGSGKSTVAERLAERLGWLMMEGDRLHPPANVEKMRRGIPLDDADRAPWLDRIGEELKAWAAAGRSGVLTCSALKRAYRARILAARPDVRFVYLKGSKELIAGRVSVRHHEYMPASLLAEPVRDPRRAGCRASRSSSWTRAVRRTSKCRRSSTRSADPARGAAPMTRA